MTLTLRQAYLHFGLGYPLHMARVEGVSWAHDGDPKDPQPWPAPPKDPPLPKPGSDGAELDDGCE